MIRSIDINSDTGERPEALRDGSEELLFQYITSANIACGVHAGDGSTMERTVRLAMKYNVAIGAHPGYPDRGNFGRLSMRLSKEEIINLVYEQLRTLGQITSALRTAIVHLKPHGALYGDAARDPVIAAAIADGAAKWSKELILVGFAASVMIDVWKEKGLVVASEAFADRVYENDGSLRLRNVAGALISDPKVAAQQALNIATNKRVLTAGGREIPVTAGTMCVHSDTPSAAEIAKAVRQELAPAGIVVQRLDSKLGV